MHVLITCKYEKDPIKNCRENVMTTAILPLPLIQEEQLSVTGERMCTKYW